MKDTLFVLMEVKQDVMVVSVSLFGLAQRVYKKFRENIPKSWKKLMKVKMKIKQTIPKETLKR